MSLNPLRLVRVPETIIQTFALTVAQNYDLPSTGVKAGQMVLVYNTTVNNSTLTIRASDLTSIESIDRGHMLLTAQQDNPTTNTHWHMSEIYSFTENLLRSLNNMNASPPNIRLNIVRFNDQVHITNELAAITASKTTTADPATTVAIPSQYFKATMNNMQNVVQIRNNAVYEAGVGIIDPSGILTFSRITLATWNSGADARIMTFTLNYTLGTT